MSKTGYPGIEVTGGHLLSYIFLALKFKMDRPKIAHISKNMFISNFCKKKHPHTNLASIRSVSGTNWFCHLFNHLLKKDRVTAFSAFEVTCAWPWCRCAVELLHPLKPTARLFTKIYPGKTGFKVIFCSFFRNGAGLEELLVILIQVRTHLAESVGLRLKSMVMTCHPERISRSKMAYANIRTTIMHLHKPQNEKSSWQSANTFFTWWPLLWCLDLRPTRSVIYPGPPTILPYLSEAPRLELVSIQLEDSKKIAHPTPFRSKGELLPYHKLTHGLPIVVSKQKSSVS